ncbi:MAG: T9SS type A sorting domain-containing protein [Ignavibacteria bacterium]
MKIILLIVTVIIFSQTAFPQGSPPWQHPLKICRSIDGTTFSDIKTFQDSAGVPCVINPSEGNLISAFQWFRQPVGSDTWDRVAIKFSSDYGITWTEPQPIVINGLPLDFQRPFDPALAISDNGKLRMYFSSGQNLILDTSINTYSAISDDGVNFNFEPNIRFSLPDRPVIDPAVIKFNGLWHLVNPATMSTTGAYHNVSGNGLDFMRVPDIVSDQQHSWIGNFMIKDSAELRFYGSGMRIWYSSSPNGGIWSSFLNTNIMGGDPSVVKLSDNNYLMIYTGPPYPVSVNENNLLLNGFELYQNYPNPFNPETVINYELRVTGDVELKVYGVFGNEVSTLVNEKQITGSYSVTFDGNNFPSGVYFYKLHSGNFVETKRMVLLK